MLFPHDYAVAGCVTGDCNNGQGTYVYDSGATFEGGWRYGFYYGHGTYTDKSGNKSTGNWINNNPDGEIIKISPDGNRYRQVWQVGMILSEEKIGPARSTPPSNGADSVQDGKNRHKNKKP